MPVPGPPARAGVPERVMPGGVRTDSRGGLLEPGTPTPGRIRHRQRVRIAVLITVGVDRIRDRAIGCGIAAVELTSRAVPPEAEPTTSLPGSRT